MRTLGERLAVNTVIQGTAADIIKLAMVRMPRARSREAGLQTRLILTIHDELLFEGPPEEADAARELIEREMVAPWEHATRRSAVDVGVGAELAGGEVDGPRRSPSCSTASVGRRWSRCRRRSTRAWARRVGTFQAAFFSFLVGTRRAAA